MSLGLITVLSILGLAGVFCLGQLIRNSIVYEIRTKLINKDYGLYKRLPTYDSMMWQWSMWTVEAYENKYKEDTND